MNWLAFAVSNYLVRSNKVTVQCKKYDTALEVIDEFENTLLKEGKESLKHHEKSEVALFKARIYEAKGDHEAALKILRKKGLIVD
jgi:hypothetical protein